MFFYNFLLFRQSFSCELFCYWSLKKGTFFLYIYIILICYQIFYFKGELVLWYIYLYVRKICLRLYIIDTDVFCYLMLTFLFVSIFSLIAKRWEMVRQFMFDESCLIFLNICEKYDLKPLVQFHSLLYSKKTIFRFYFSETFTETNVENWSENSHLMNLIQCFLI